MMGKGAFGVTIDQGPGMRPYQGITPLAGGSLAACAETYFAQSEQLATRFAVVGAEAQEPGRHPRWRAGGLMIQQMPDEGGHAPDAPSGEDGLMTADDVAAMGSREEDWSRVNFLLGTLDAHELIGPHVQPEALLVRLFHEEVPSVYEAQPVEFGCTCSAERVERGDGAVLGQGHRAHDDRRRPPDRRLPVLRGALRVRPGDAGLRGGALGAAAEGVGFQHLGRRAVRGWRGARSARNR